MLFGLYLMKNLGSIKFPIGTKAAIATKVLYSGQLRLDPMPFFCSAIAAAVGDLSMEPFSSSRPRREVRRRVTGYGASQFMPYTIYAKAMNAILLNGFSQTFSSFQDAGDT